MAKTEIATVQQDDDALPDYLKGQTFKNEDNFGVDDVTLPRIKLLQATSEELKMYDAAKSGVFWHTGMDMPLGTSFKFVVADRRRKYLLLAPITDGQGLLARADDALTWDKTGTWNVKFKGVKDPVKWTIDNLSVAKSGLAEWGTSIPSDENSPPAATLIYDYLVFLPDMPELGPAVISIARTAVKKAKKGLNDKIKLHGDNGRPMQALVFEAKAVEDSANDQDFLNWQFTQAGFVRDPEAFERYRSHVGALARFVVADEGGADLDPRGDDEPEDEGEARFCDP